METTESQQELDKQILQSQRKVLIIVTGGTICMQPTEQGLKVKKKYIEKFIRQNPNFCDSEYTYFHGQDNWIITPQSIYKKRIFYKVYEFEEIIDSSNMQIQDWVNISNVVWKNHDQYDSFVILHGTDTMGFTASAMSFMFENLKKTIILTGSQLPLTFLRSDGYSNLLNSLIIAGHFDIPEVMILFENQVFRGNRCRKVNSESFDGFDSPNYDSLIQLGINYKIGWENIIVPDKSKETTLFTSLSDKIAIFKYSPVFNEQILDNILNKENIEAVIIESFGSGNLPSQNQKLLEKLKKACDNEILIVNISQCYRYKVDQNVYETGKVFGDLGIISGSDMTVECTIAKLAYLLGKRKQDPSKYSYEYMKEQIQENLRGELTSHKQQQNKYKVKEEHFLETLIQSMNTNQLQNEDIQHLLQSLVLPNIVCFMCKYGFIKFLKSMDISKMDLNQLDYDNRTPLHVAASSNNSNSIHVVQYLIDQKVSINIVDKMNRSPLFESLLTKNLQVCKLIYKNGGKIMADPDAMFDLLIQYVQNNEIGMFEFINQIGIDDFNQYKNVDSRNIGHVSVTLQNVGVIDFLKKQTSFDFMQQDRWGKSCLDLAEQMGNIEIIQIIKDYKVNNNQYYGSSMLSIRSRSRSREDNHRRTVRNYGQVNRRRFINVSNDKTFDDQ